MTQEIFDAIVERLVREYQVSAVREHNFVVEFYEGPIPLFKLLAQEETESNPAIIIASFHLELDIVAAIQWFLRIRALDPNLHLTSAYLKDVSGVTYIGADAHALYLHTVQQAAVQEFIEASNSDEANTPHHIERARPSAPRVFTNVASAMQTFQKMQKKKGDVFH